MEYEVCSAVILGLIIIDSSKYLLFLTSFWRDGRVVECGGLENRCPAIVGPGVRTPLSPHSVAITRCKKGDSEFFTSVFLQAWLKYMKPLFRISLP
jgi:hypothetical protein